MGGPWARDSWGYNPEVQFLANRGYAVLQMNFRASTGYGRKFTELGYKQWGQTMQNDITDGVEWLIKKGIADPKREPSTAEAMADMQHWQGSPLLLIFMHVPSTMWVYPTCSPSCRLSHPIGNPYWT